MWILNWLPDWFFYVILISGLMGFVLTYLLKFIPIPFIYVYKTPIQLVSILFLVFGTFMVGAIYDNNSWLNKVKELQEKVAQAQKESKDANEKLNDATKIKKEKIIEKRVAIKEYIDREIIKYDNKCEIPQEFIEILNKAATGSDK